jgi:predicted ATP-grasp superfamily ATP-dependent carboligase
LADQETVLVTDSGARAAIGIIRSLLAQGVNVTAASEHRLCASFKIRGLSQRQIHPSIEKSPQQFTDWLLDYLAKHQVKMLISLGDTGAELTAKYQDEIRKHTILYVPSYENFMIAYDKIKANKAAQQAGIATPRCWYPDEDGLDPALKSDYYPLLVKPAVGVGARGITRVDSPLELEKAWGQTKKTDTRFFVQERIPLTGKQYVVDVLMDCDLKTAAAVVSEKVRFYPIKAGASTLSRSISRPDLCQSCTKLLGSMGYFGIANVDLIEDPRDGEAKFLEINPRFGEMHAICTAVGVDLPTLLYNLACGKPLPQPVTDYPEDRYLRFLPTDLMWFLRSPDRFKTKPGFFRSFDSNVTHTLFENGDIGPLFGYAMENLALLFNPKKFAYRFVR